LAEAAARLPHLFLLERDAKVIFFWQKNNGNEKTENEIGYFFF
jgi:hypothetical protein